MSRGGELRKDPAGTLCEIGLKIMSILTIYIKIIMMDYKMTKDDGIWKH
jgi:hypothetical protein